jgi:hypothetical protein
MTGYGIVIRDGSWTGSNGFGQAKYYNYHNLFTQPVVDTITYGGITGEPDNKDYTVVYRQADGSITLFVVVVADTTDHYFQGTYTQDGRELGVMTAFCQDPSRNQEPRCPDWVNNSGL